MSDETRACEYESPGYCRTHGLPLTAAGECPAAPLAPSEAGGRAPTDTSMYRDGGREWLIARVRELEAEVARLASRPSSGEDSDRLPVPTDALEATSQFAGLVAEAMGLDREGIEDAENWPHENLLPLVNDMRIAAERYRFLRDNPLGLRAVDGNAKYPPPTAEQMDDYVDGAIEGAAALSHEAHQ